MTQDKSSASSCWAAETKAHQPLGGETMAEKATKKAQETRKNNTMLEYQDSTFLLGDFLFWSALTISLHIPSQALCGFQVWS